MRSLKSALLSNFRFSWWAMAFLLLVLSLLAYDVFYDPDKLGLKSIVLLTNSILFFYLPVSGYGRFPKVDNPFDKIHMDQEELVMDDARFKVDKVKQVIIQPTRRNNKEVGQIVFFRNHRNSSVPSLTFNLEYIEALKAFIGEHLPNTEIIQSDDY
jgi:hypothetical protein